MLCILLLCADNRCIAANGMTIINPGEVNTCMVVGV